MKQLIAILVGLGVPKAEAEKLAGLTDEQLKDWTGDTTVESIKTNIKNLLSNDQSFLDSIPEDKIPSKIKKDIEKNQYARFQNELVDVATKELGLEDKVDLTDDDKKSIKKLTATIAKKYFSKNSNDDSAKKLNTELGEARQLLAQREEEFKTKLETETGAIAGKYNAKLIKSLVQGKLTSLDKIKLNVGAEFLADPVLSKLGSKYSVVLGDNDELDIMQKENPKLHVMDAAGKSISFDSALRSVVIDSKLGSEMKEDEGGGGAGGKKKVIIGGGNGDGGGGNDDAIELPDYIQKSVDANRIPEAK